MDKILKLGLTVGILIMVVTGLTACGVKSHPTPPDGGTYPQQYPAALPPEDVVPRESSRHQDEQSLQNPTLDPNGIYQYPNTRPIQ